MTIPNITWRGDAIDDNELLPELPDDLRDLLGESNGFIVERGAIHVRGVSLGPEWHSLREAWRGENAFHRLYPTVNATDIPFAQDQLGDQFLLRKGGVFRLQAETGEVEEFCGNLEEFLEGLRGDVEDFFDVGLGLDLDPGQLIHAWPPFCVSESEENVSLKAVPAADLIGLHADFAKQIRDTPDGGRIRVEIVD